MQSEAEFLLMLTKRYGNVNEDGEKSPIICKNYSCNKLIIL